MLTRLIAVLLFCLCTILAAPPAIEGAHRLERDLGQGLSYHRIHELPADLPTGSGAPLQPSVVDVRYVSASPAAATAFVAWLNFRATTRAPIFILVNGETDRALLASLHRHAPEAGILVIGRVAGGFQPDIVVPGSAEDERRSYDAFESGTAVAALLADNPDKVRHDEANIGKERRGEAEGDSSTAAAKERARPPVDAALQRAVQVHRALLALKKI